MYIQVVLVAAKISTPSAYLCSKMILASYRGFQKEIRPWIPTSIQSILTCKASGSLPLLLARDLKVSGIEDSL